MRTQNLSRCWSGIGWYPSGLRGLHLRDTRNKLTYLATTHQDGELSCVTQLSQGIRCVTVSTKASVLPTQITHHFYMSAATAFTMCSVCAITQSSIATEKHSQKNRASISSTPAHPVSVSVLIIPCDLDMDTANAPATFKSMAIQ